MAVPLNRIPPGLLDFFGIKSGEWGPRELGQLLSPVLDLSRWYLDNNSVEIFATPTVTNVIASTNAGALTIASVSSQSDVLNTGNITVPAGETWLLLEASINWNFSAHGGSQADLAWVCSGLHLPMLLQGVQNSFASAQAQGARSLARPVWVLPGQQLFAFVYAASVGAGGTITWGAAPVALPKLRFVRFRI